MPPNLRVVEVSAWRERLKQACDTCSGVMPMPVSRTEKLNLDAV